MLALQSKAPEFSLPDQNNTIHSLREYRGKWVLLYFYPKDSTPGCTTEACTLRDEYAEFKKRGIIILGVSADTVKSHTSFAQKFSLPFTLLSNESKDMIKKYEAWGKKNLWAESTKEYFGFHT